jgi:hypothetical protein
MVYVLRLANGDSIITSARDDREAREAAYNLGLEAGDEVVSVRRLPQFCVRLTPADTGTLDVNCWDDATLDDLLIHEYPQMNAAIQAANRVKFLPNPDPTKPVFDQLREAYEKNKEIIREGIRLEQQKPEPAPTTTMRKAARK